MLFNSVISKGTSKVFQLVQTRIQSVMLPNQECRHERYIDATLDGGTSAVLPLNSIHELVTKERLQLLRYL